ncbi:MAG: hypothetical protein ACOYXW_16995 [Actinomycetota bacterium]
MRFFRRRPDPLGDGVWRHAHDRFRRAVDRYHQMLEQVPPGQVRDRLEVAGAALAGALDDVHRLCAHAQGRAPSTGLDVPGGPDGSAPELHRRLTRAAGLAAQAAEAAAMARVALRSGAGADPEARVAAAERSVAGVRALLAG